MTWTSGSTVPEAIFREHLRVLVEEVRGPMREDRVSAALEEATRVLAVSVLGEREAVESLIAAARRAVGAPGDLPADGPQRLLRVERLAGEWFTRHRARIAAIRERELRRSAFVAARAGNRRGTIGAG